MDDIGKIVSRLDQLRNLAIRESATLQVQNEIIKVIRWLTGNRSVQEHRACFAFLQYLHETDGRWPDNFPLFVDEVKISVGHCLRRVTDAVIDGQNVRFEKYITKSLAFGTCTQDEFHKFFERVKNLARDKYKVEFEMWFENYCEGVK